MDTTLDRILAHLSVNEPQALERLFACLQIASVSTSPAHASDCSRCVEWFAMAFTAMGFRTRVCATPGQPALVARRPRANARRIVYYGHYDVQPAEPLEDWLTPPFAPRLAAGPRGPCIRARGAADDKGQVLAWMAAFQAHLDVVGDLPVDLTVVLEGEEETGSPNFDHVLRSCADDLSGDVVVVSDGTMWDAVTPSITTRLRGLVYAEIQLEIARHDLHSGLFGGIAPNAAMALCELLADLKDGQGRIALPGFYEGLRPPSAAAVASWQTLGFDEDAVLATAGAVPMKGEPGRSALERLWARPTADINGIWSGYTGSGSKTIIPHRATAKLSFRLVPGQSPEGVVKGLRAFVAERCPAGTTARVMVLEAAPAVEMPQDTLGLDDVRRALADEFGKPPVMIGCGGSLGAIESFQRVLGVPSLLFSFGLDDDCVHAPNEKFDLACYRHAARTHARLLQNWRCGADHDVRTTEHGQSDLDAAAHSGAGGH